MTRRVFVTLPALALPASGLVALPAIAAAAMPGSLLLDRSTVRRLVAQNRLILEKRVYSANLRATFRELGLPVVPGSGSLLFAFESLEARESAWRNVGFAGHFELKELAIYQIPSNEHPWHSGH